MTMQAAWGLLMLWLVLMIAGDAVFTGKGRGAAGGLCMQHMRPVGRRMGTGACNTAGLKGGQDKTALMFAELQA